MFSNDFFSSNSPILCLQRFASFLPLQNTSLQITPTTPITPITPAIPTTPTAPITPTTQTTLITPTTL